MGPAKRAVEEEDSTKRRKAARKAPLGTDERTRVTHDTRPTTHDTRKNTHDTNDDSSSFLVRGGLGVVRARRMVDSSAFVSNGARLRETLRRDGYALLRGFLDARDVESARAVALEALMASKPDLFLLEDPGGAKEQDLKKQAGLLRPDARALGLLARQDVAARAEVRRVTECDALFDVAARVLFSDDGDVGLIAKERTKRTKRTKRTSSPPSPRLAMTTAYKWLRAVAGGEFTGVHTDRVFLGGGSGRLVTAWIPLGDVRVADGALMVAAGSHADATFAGVRRTYGASAAGADGANSGWLTDDAAEVLDVARRLNRSFANRETRGAANRSEENVADAIDWRTCDFQSGDVVLLALDVVHMSLTNVSGEEGGKNGAARARVSVDTRWQPEGDDPDPRVRAWRVRREGAVETVTL